MITLNSKNGQKPSKQGWVVVGHVDLKTYSLSWLADPRITPIIKAGDIVYQWYGRKYKLIVPNAHYGFEFHCMDTEALDHIRLQRDLAATLQESIQ
jgi:hypothetical protein